jgi:glyceraldehyde-3-phosphate dehydrogenase (NADP+)
MSRSSVPFPALHRVSRLVDQARSQGARVLTGGSTDGARYLPTLLEQVPEHADLAREEIFGPVTTLEPFDTLQEAITLANRTGGGIQAGIFTQRRETADLLSDALDVGGIVLGGGSDHRSDAMPFGGTGAAGVGREGVTYATAAMTHAKTLLSAPLAQT